MHQIISLKSRVVVRSNDSQGVARSSASREEAFIRSTLQKVAKTQKGHQKPREERGLVSTLSWLDFRASIPRERLLVSEDAEG